MNFETRLARRLKRIAPLLKVSPYISSPAERKPGPTPGPAKENHATPNRNARRAARKA